MTAEPPDHRGRSRSDAASRLAALLSDVDGDAPVDDAPVPPVERPTIRRRESLAADPPGSADLGADDVDLAALDSLLRDIPSGPTADDALPPLKVPTRPEDRPEAPEDLPPVAVPETSVEPPVAREEMPALPVVEGAPDDLVADDASDPDATQRLAVLDVLAARVAAPDPVEGAEDLTVPAIPTDELVEPEADLDADAPVEALDAAVAQVAEPAFSAPPSDPPRPPGLVPVVEPGAEAEEPDDLGPPPRLRRVTPRAVAFCLLLVALVAAIPLLGLQGKDRVLASRGGEVVSGSRDPSEPGYRALVEPTPTALVVHRSETGAPISLTLLSLGAGSAGGTVLQIPLQTQVYSPYYYLDRLQAVWDFDEDDDQLFRAVEERIGTNIAEPVDVDDDSLAALVGPVAPLTFDNPDPVATPEGDAFPAGELTLGAEQIGPFLRASSEGETELGRLARTEIVWTAWLEAIGAAGTQDSVGAATTGIGPFLRVLAEGSANEPSSTVVATLDVAPPESSEMADPPLVPTPVMEEQIADAVPYPRPPSLGRRIVIELLNGVDGGELPMSVMHDLVVAGGAISKIGNASTFGQEETTIEITNEGWREPAEQLRTALGPDVEIRVLSPQAAQSLDVDAIVTLGSDVLDETSSGG